MTAQSARVYADRAGRIFLGCLAVALALHAGTLFTFQDYRFFSVLAAREDTARLFRVPVSEQLRELPPRSQRAPEQIDNIAALERGIAEAVSDTIAELPRIPDEDPLEATRLESFAQNRRVDEAPPRFEAPSYLADLERSAADLAFGAVRDDVQVVARAVGSDPGAARVISAPANRATGQTGRGADVAIPAVARPLPPSIPKAAVPVRRVQEPEPERVAHKPEVTDVRLEAVTPDERPVGEPWDEYFAFELQVYRPDATQPGYFRVDAIPKVGASLPVAARDIVFVLDASRSMGSHRVRYATEAFAAAIRALHPDDHFTVAAFKSALLWWRQGTQSATAANRGDAIDWLERLEAGGHTNIYAGLDPALQIIGESPRPVIMIICSDGRPTTGPRDSRMLINELTYRNAGRASIFTFGSGRDTNNYLLDLLAYRNRGEAEFAVSAPELREQLPRLEESVRAPVLLRPTVVVGQAGDTVYPKDLSDVYVQRPLHIWGRLQPGATHLGLHLQGLSQGGLKDIIVEMPVPPTDTATQSIAQEWAIQKALYLTGRVTADDDRTDLHSQLAQHVQTYGLPEDYMEAATAEP